MLSSSCIGEMIGKFDAAVIDQEDGNPTLSSGWIARAWEDPGVVRGGTLPRKELHEVAEVLTGNQAGLIVVGEPTIDKGLDKAFSGAAEVVSALWTPRPTKSPASCRRR